MKQIEVVTVPVPNKCGERQPVLMQVEWKGVSPNAPRAQEAEPSCAY